MDVRNNLAAIRKERGLSVAETAALIGVTRQTVYAIEAGNYIPNTLVALKLAQAFSVPVEALFFLDAAAAERRACDVAQLLPGMAAAAVGQPVHLVQVGKRLVATDLTSTSFRQPADAVVVKLEARKRPTVQVQTFVPAERRQKRLLVVGDDPAFLVLSHHLQLAGIDLVVVGHQASPFVLLRQGLVHIACHTAEGCRSSIPHRRAAGRDMAVLGLYAGEEGLVTAPGNPKAIAAIADLARPDVGIVNREPGTRCRRLLDAGLAQLGLTGAAVRGYAQVVQGHMPAVWHVYMRKADCCLATRQAAAAFGLTFVPLARRQTCLILRKESLNLPEIVETVEILHKANFRRELELCCGCDAAAAGTVLADLP